MSIVWVIIGFMVLMFAYVLYDKVSWYKAKKEEARQGAVLIAGIITDLRKSLSLPDTPTKYELDNAFKTIQILNAKSAYILGGIRLMEKVAEASQSEIITRQ